MEKNVKIWVRKFDEVTGKTVYQTKLFDVSGEELQRHLHQERKVFIDIETSNIRIKKLKLSEKSNTKDESAKDCAKFWGHLMNLVQLCTVLQTFWASVYVK